MHRMSERPLAHIIYQVSKMLVGLLEKEFGFGKKVVTEVRIVGPVASDRIFVVDRTNEVR